MPRLMSFALTEKQFLDGSKTVTRRLGWQNLQRGDVLIAVRKAMGLKKGEKAVRLGMLEVEWVSFERLNSIDQTEVNFEGFPDMNPEAFIGFFCRTHKGCARESIVTRIEFRKLDREGV